MNKKETGLLVMVLGLDLLTKIMVSRMMELGQSIPIIRGFFHITYVTNTGAAWSMLKGKMLFFYLMTIVAVFVLGWMLKKTARRAKITRIGLVLILAGAIGNFIDRLLYQYVRDFLDFTIFGYNFPVFNVADISLCIGVFLTLLMVFLKKEDGDESA